MSSRYDHLLKIGNVIGVAIKEVKKSERTSIYQTILQNMPWHEIEKHLKIRRKSTKEVWGIIWPDGRVFLDSNHDKEEDAWMVALNWPSDKELPQLIENAKKYGIRAKKILVDLR